MREATAIECIEQFIRVNQVYPQKNDYSDGYQKALADILSYCQHAKKIEKKQKEEAIRQIRDEKFGLYAIEKNPNEVTIEWVRENAFEI